MLTVQMPHPSHDRVECAIHHEGGYVPLRHAELFMRGFRMTEIQWHWCFSLGEYHDGKRSLNRRGTKSRRRRGFDKCQRSLRGGRVLPQLRERKVRETSIKWALLRLSADDVVPPNGTTGNEIYFYISRRNP